MRKSLLVGVLLLLARPSPGLHAQATQNSQPAKTQAARKKSASANPADRHLSLSQIRKLISIRTPDQIVAQEIQSRGISEDYTRKDVDQMRKTGAGPLTVSALLQSLPVATLIVRTEPGASVRLDADSPRLAGSDGTVTISNIDPGPRQITAQKQNFTSATRSVEVKGRETLTVDLKLTWAVGFLTVTTNAPDSRVEVSGRPAQMSPLSRVPVPVGQVTVAAIAPLRKTVSQTVTIQPGREAMISLSLPVDEGAVNVIAGQIHSSFRSRQYQAVLQHAAEYRQTGAREKDVLAEIAISCLELKNYSEFQQSARQALTAGATLSFEVMHHHLALGGFAGGTLHPAELQVSANSLAYNPVGRCNIRPFKTPKEQVRIGIRDAAPLDSSRNIPVVNLSVPDASNPKKQVTLNLSAGTGAGGSSAGEFNDDSSKVDAIRELLRTVMY